MEAYKQYVSIRSDKHANMQNIAGPIGAGVACTAGTVPPHVPQLAGQLLAMKTADAPVHSPFDFHDGQFGLRSAHELGTGGTEQATFEHIGM